MEVSIIEIGLNTEKSPGDLRRLAVTQTPVKKQSANADVKTLHKVKNNDCYFSIRIIVTGTNTIDLRQQLKDLLTKLDW